MFANIVRCSRFAAVSTEGCLNTAECVCSHALTFLHLGNFSLRYAHFKLLSLVVENIILQLITACTPLLNDKYSTIQNFFKSINQKKCVSLKKIVIIIDIFQKKWHFCTICIF